jgi:hypothetical protein
MISDGANVMDMIQKGANVSKAAQEAGLNIVGG